MTAEPPDAPGVPPAGGPGTPASPASPASPAAPLPPPPSAAWAPPPPSAPKSRRWIWWLVGGIVTFLLVIGIGIVVLVVFVINLVTAPVDASNDFLDHLRDRQYQAASAQLCDASPYESARTLALRLERDGPITSFDLDQSSITNDAGYVGGTIETGGVSHRIVLDVAKEDGSWKVCDAALDVAFPNSNGSGG
jgi:hypothetical protein